MTYENGVGCCRMLVVEDDFFIREDIAEHMRQAGHDVTTAASGEHALRQLEGKDRFDVLFTDISLGGQADGWTVALEFRRAMPEITVIYASANPNDPSRSVLPSRFFAKPYDAHAVEHACRHGPDGA